MAYKFSVIPQYIMLVLLAVLSGIAFTSPKIHFVGYFGIPAFVLEAIFLCFQRNGKYVNIPVFAYGMIVNTIIGLFNGFLDCILPKTNSRRIKRNQITARSLC